MQTVLISGGGTAGPVLAYWLRRHGFAPTVVEHAPGLRPGGQAVDIRGVALDVVERMGLLEQARRVRTRMRGMSVLAPDGQEIDRSTEATFSSGRLDNGDIELLREDLVQMVYEHTRADVEYLFGNSITALHEDETGVRVDFTHEASRTFDLVIGADGLHSTVRRLAFGPEEHFAHHLGSYLSVFSADNFLALDNWQMWLRDGDAGFGIMPVRDNAELRIAFGFMSAPLADDLRKGDVLRQLVHDKLASLQWEGARLAKAVETAPDFYCDAMAQIRMEHWSQGRVALLGDAGYCPSPLSGQGTSLALVGAYVLASCLAQAHGDHRAAYSRYEQQLRPFVTLNQALATENPGGPASEASVAHAKNAIALNG
ncbi:FAD-dependent monooxygenase [Streptomyces zagrosensis]|uniref:2-polyprenyl-6-methoxyphenol hydroxylase-like FAD-dependent oxidoreductase n=1 Tax=Streptomyces zagrosensis TaxID=1042984 RepID=A0A7W9Q7R3_9ACTN|nr:FAD-dependent monooxygenase [Streptomyces zagrosensis]MBB5935168.1 2-polyprenyl-6-methoxyphenol hydroxylase-like FAD-dependent oxidoreductase [Streptomyces zagrosensis]